MRILGAIPTRSQRDFSEGPHRTGTPSFHSDVRSHDERQRKERNDADEEKKHSLTSTKSRHLGVFFPLRPSPPNNSFPPSQGALCVPYPLFPRSPSQSSTLPLARLRNSSENDRMFPIRTIRFKRERKKERRELRAYLEREHSRARRGSW